ncbi:MAG: L,D-transpeptidase [Anaerolineales bacterium]
MSKSDLSRRDFLKLSGYGLMGMILPNLPLTPPAQENYLDLQGRVTDRVLWSYTEPNPKSKRVKLYWRDIVLPITDSTIGEDESAYNRVWYKTEEGGYIYSGSVQPVRTMLNEPQMISLKGALGEVSVPYTDAREAADINSKVIYRLYYETVHWITASAISQVDGSKWYYLLDDKFKQFYYAPAEHFRLIQDSELAPLSPDVPDEEKSVEVRLDDQLLIAYEKKNIVFATRVASGGVMRSGTYTTPVGHFITFHKRPTRHMAAGDIAASGFDLPGVPWVLYITEGGISFHGTYWHNDFGRPRSHGCINLTPQAAKWLFRWTNPSVPPGKEFSYGYVGTKVDINV